MFVYTLSTLLYKQLSSWTNCVQLMYSVFYKICFQRVVCSLLLNQKLKEKICTIEMDSLRNDDHWIRNDVIPSLVASGKITFGPAESPACIRTLEIYRIPMEESFMLTCCYKVTIVLVEASKAADENSTTIAVKLVVKVIFSLIFIIYFLMACVQSLAENR